MLQIFNILSELSFGYISTFEERSLKALVTEAQGISHKLCCTSPFQDWEPEVMKSSTFSLPAGFGQKKSLSFRQLQWLQFSKSHSARLPPSIHKGILPHVTVAPPHKDKQVWQVTPLSPSCFSHFMLYAVCFCLSSP